MGAKEVSGRNFLRLGTAAGLVAAGVPILASCGKELPKVKSGTFLIAEKKLEPNSAYVFAGAETDDPRVVVRLESGEIPIYSAECIHRGCTVGYKAEEQHPVCHCHDSKQRTLASSGVCGGGNFGIVTEFEFRLNPVGPSVLATGVRRRCAPTGQRARKPSQEPRRAATRRSPSQRSYSSGLMPPV